MKLIIDISEEDYEFTKGATTARYFTPEYYVNLILNGTPLDDLKAEIREKSFNHYFEYGEYIGEDCRKERIIYSDQVLEILDHIGKESEE